MLPERRVELRFGRESQAAQTHTNLSAVRLAGNCLWAAGDETAMVERLTATTDDQGRITAFGISPRPTSPGRPPGSPRPTSPDRPPGHRGFPLADFVALPAGPDAEADIEGLAHSAGWLWAVGSHSLKRKKVKSRQSAAKARRRLAAVEREENRFILARLPLAPGQDGLPEAVRETPDGRSAAVLGGHGDAITDLLAGDPHLAPFLAIPGKDNGIDIEGIAVRGDRVLVGLRGPVLRGWAVLIELRPGPHPGDPGRLRLNPVHDGAPYRTHFLDLGGLGIRDLCPYGDDLLILTGPSMDLDGPVRLIRWHGAAAVEEPAVVPADAVEVLGDLPYGHGDDHAEGITLLDEPDGPRLLVVYDSPAADRHTPEGGILADVVALPR